MIVPVPVADGASSGDRLSAAEREVLALAARGLSNEAMGRRLGVGPEAIRYRARRVLDKLGARNRCHAVALAYELGILAVDGEDGSRRAPRAA